MYKPEHIVPLLRNRATIAQWDFTSGGTFPELTYGNSVAGAVSRDSLVYRATGEARTSSLGLLVEPERANKCANYFNPVNTNGTVADGNWSTHEAYPIASWPQNALDTLPVASPAVTSCYHSISTAAGAIAVDGVTGNTNPHTSYGYIYIVSGDGGFGLGSSTIPLTTTGSWQRFGQDNEGPLNGTRQLTVGTSQASKILWFLTQMEEGAARTSPIKVNGSTVTRLGDAPYDATSNWNGWDKGQFIIVIRFSKFLAASALFDRVFQLDNGLGSGGNICALSIRPTGEISLGDGTGAADINAASAITLGQTYKVAFGLNGTSAAMAIDGTYVGTNTFTVPASYDYGRFGCNNNNQVQLGGYIPDAAVYKETWTQARLEELSA